MHAGPHRLADLGGSTVLVVDDFLEDRGIVASMLDLAGAGVFEVSGGDEAKATIPHLRPDVVITELALPDATGLELARWIRQYDHASLRATVLVALTRWAREYSSHAARAAGFDGYFTKPPTTDDLVVGLAALLRASRKPV
jgi:CheY-like chemotaxis protein